MVVGDVVSYGATWVPWCPNSICACSLLHQFHIPCNVISFSWNDLLEIRRMSRIYEGTPQSCGLFSGLGGPANLTVAIQSVADNSLTKLGRGLRKTRRTYLQIYLDMKGTARSIYVDTT